MLTAKQVADHYRENVRNTRNRVYRDGKPGPWARYCAPGTFDFLEMPPPRPSRFQKRTPTMTTSAAELPAELAAHVLPGEKLALKQGIPEPPPGANKLAWAAYWAMRGLKVFPCESFTGSPLIGFFKSDIPSNNLTQIQRWWTATPDADIGHYPDDAGLFIVEIHRNCTEEPDIDFSDAVIVGESMLGDQRFWFPGRVFTKLHALGQWVHLIGIGEYGFLPPSLAGGLVQ